MIRVCVLYPATEGATFDEEYYFDKHYKLCQTRLAPEGMVSCQFDKGVADAAGGKPPYLAIAHLVFKTLDDFQKAMGKHGEEVGGDVKNYTNIRPIMQINEIAAG